MKNIKNMITRKYKILLIVPILIAVVSLIVLKISEKSAITDNLKEARFTWELSNLDTRGIQIQDNYIISKVGIIGSNQILEHIVRNLDGFISEANKKNCKITFNDWYKGKLVIKKRFENLLILDLNQFEEKNVFTCKEFVHDYVVDYIGITIDIFIKSNEKEINLLNDSVINYNKKLKINIDKIKKSFGEDILFNDRFFQQNHIAMHLNYLTILEERIFNLSSRVLELKTMEKKLNLIQFTIKDSAKSRNALLTAFISYIFGLIISILYIAVVEAKTIGRYFN